MPNLVIVGAQWGDEGKGKLVDSLSAAADYVVRFQGGNNAGHTLVIDGQQTKLNLIPSGILRQQTRCVIAAGVVLNPEVLLTELDQLGSKGVEVSPDRLLIDGRSQIVMPYHIAIDQAREDLRGSAKIGTTGRGIGPAYEDRAARSGILMAQLLALDELKPLLKELVESKNRYLQQFLGSDQTVDFAQLWTRVEGYARRLAPYIRDAGKIVRLALRAGERVVCEGAQGTLLDQMHGTIPFVTSSSTLAGAVTSGIGLGCNQVDFTLGVAKAYCTRVGAGPFPTELKDQTGDLLREKGHEFGTVTGRARRCGWLDAVALKQAVELNGFDALAITKLDVLSNFDQIRIAVSYKVADRELEHFPLLASEFEGLEADYIEIPGWPGDISKVTAFEDLPPSAQAFIGKIEELVGCDVRIVSVGPERDALIIRSNRDNLRSFIDFKQLE